MNIGLFHLNLPPDVDAFMGYAEIGLSAEAPSTVISATRTTNTVTL